MIFGAELNEFILFLRQFGLALAGAAALWGAVFVAKSRHSPASEAEPGPTSSYRERLVHGWLAEKLMILLTVGFLTAAMAWFILLFLPPVQAHEGITLILPEERVFAALNFAAPIFLLWVLFTAAGLGARKYFPVFFRRNLGRFYFFQFLFVFLLMGLGVRVGGFSREQFFFWGHTIHSVFTLGTVLVLDFLFLASKNSEILKQHVYPWFSTISKVIWSGLGIDFLSSFLVFESAFSPTPKFFFMQTVVGIVIINGAFLSGPIARKLLASVAKSAGARKIYEVGLHNFGVEDVAGTISIASWTIITFVDFFHNLTLNYGEFILAYLVWIAVLLVVHLFWEKCAPRFKMV